MKTAFYVRRPLRGISLIEALVALAIMAIGMLGIVGVQSTLRSTSDVAKQRGEAVRIAQIEIERWRAFMTLAGGSTTNYADLPADATPVVIATVVGTNATYSVNRTVTVLPLPRRGKALRIGVEWQDRTGLATQRVELSTLIAGISPELSATLAVPVGASVLQQLGGRKGGIPLGAKDLGGGRSGWIPPGSTPGVAWVFNNITGVITICTTTAATVADLIYNPGSPGSDNVTCTAEVALYVSGFVRYALDPVQPTPAAAASPPSQPGNAPASNQVTVDAVYQQSSATLVKPCYVRHVNSGSGPSYSEFNCAVPALVIPGVPLSWTGKLWFGPAGLISSTLADASAARMKVCRYHAAPSYGPQSDPLANQNFLFTISGDGGSPTAVPYTCPTPLLAHQPAS